MPPRKRCVKAFQKRIDRNSNGIISRYEFFRYFSKKIYTRKPCKQLGEEYEECYSPNIGNGNLKIWNNQYVLQFIIPNDSKGESKQVKYYKFTSNDFIDCKFEYNLQCYLLKERITRTNIKKTFLHRWKEVMQEKEL